MDDEVVFNGETTLLGKRRTNPPLILDDPDHHHLPPHMGQLRPPTSNGTIHRAGPGRAVFKWFTVIIGNFCWKDFPLNFHFKFKLSKINFAMPFTKMSNFEIYSKWFKSFKHRQLKVESFCNIELIRIYFHAGLEIERCLRSGGCERPSDYEYHESFEVFGISVRHWRRSQQSDYIFLGGGDF